MLATFIEFFSLSDPNIRAVVLGMLLLTSSTALVGTFALLRKEVLIGDVMAHAALPGICLAFMATGDKHPLHLVIGAFASSWLGFLLINYITKHSKITQDTALTLVLSTTFGFGLLLLTVIQHSGNPNQVGLNNFLLGKAAALVSSDLQHLAWLGFIVVTTILFFFKEFTLITFDKSFAQASGLPVRQLEMLLSILTTITIVVSLQAVGLILMAAMLITPAAAARFWTQSLAKMIVIAMLFSAIAGLTGAFISYTTPAMPTGPWIVLASTFIAYGSFLLAPQQGLLARKMKQRRHRKKVLLENILKIFYELGAKANDCFLPATIEQLYQHRAIAHKKLHSGLKELVKNNMVKQQGAQQWCLTLLGKEKGKEISERHELWEFYLKQYLQLPHDHVHDDAEAMEHVITPDLAKTLRELMEKSSAQ